MKKRIVITILSIFSFLNYLYAQNEAEQLLVFRNTGEVNLLYSNEIDSIVCSCFDKDSVLYEDYVSQIFYARDTVLFVPIAEIDSVCFGQRNVVEYKKDVYKLSWTDISYIIRYEGNVIYYRNDTPKDILPNIGDKLFYGEMDDIFPIGLCAKVIAVERLTNEIKVSVSNVALEEIFEQLFFAGTVEPESVATPSRARRNNTRIEIPCEIKLNEHGSINVSGSVDIKTDFIVQPLRNYYYAKITMDSDMGFDFKLFLEKEFYVDDDITTFHFPNVAAVLHPQVSISAFAEINAELAFDYSMKRCYHQEWEWTSLNGVNSFVNKVSQESLSPQDEAKMDLICNGNIYVGPQFTFEFNTLLSTVGARAKLKIGPEFESEVGTGLIQSLSEEYNPELYGKAKLDVATKLGFSGHAFTRDLIYGEENEYTIFELSSKFGGTTFYLFPDFIKTRAVEMKHQNGDVAISASTISENEIIRDVEAGFQLENESTQEVLRQSFVETIFAEDVTKQGVDTELVIKETAYVPEEIVVRPIFKYAEQIILADKVGILTNDHIQPLVALTTNGVNTVISGYPVIGSVVIDSTYYNIGNYLPINIRDTVFVDNTNEVIPTIGIYIQPEEIITLLGTWKGIFEDQETCITFNGDNTGCFIQDIKMDFNYRTNYPQAGDIVMDMADNTTKVFLLYSLTENELILKNKKRNIYYTFIKQ